MGLWTIINKCLSSNRIGKEQWTVVNRIGKKQTVGTYIKRLAIAIEARTRWAYKLWLIRIWVPIASAKNSEQWSIASESLSCDCDQSQSEQEWSIASEYSSRDCDQSQSKQSQRTQSQSKDFNCDSSHRHFKMNSGQSQLEQEQSIAIVGAIYCIGKRGKWAQKEFLYVLNMFYYIRWDLI